MKRDDDVTREDFEHAVRFVADARMRTSHTAARIEALLRSTVRVLAERGTLELDAFEVNLRTPKPALRDAARVRLPVLQFNQSIDTSTIDSPDVDCASLLPLCQARCCMLTFALTPEEVEAGTLAWSYRQPYEIAHGTDHRCVHQDRPTGGCTVYADRPGVCRSYDCRADRRIWEDFERRIPAPLEAVRST